MSATRHRPDSDDGFVIDSRPQWRTALTRGMSIFMLVLNVLVACGMIMVGALQGVSPQSWSMVTAINMTFPIWVLAELALLVLDLIWWRRTALIAAAALLVCYSPIMDFWPLNIKWGMSAADKENSFTLMTYNVYAFEDYYKKGAPENRQIDFILHQNADIVCIQEAQFLAPTKSNRIAQSQLDSLHAMYPHVLTTGKDFALLSKFPAQPIVLDFPANEFSSGGMAAWRLRIHGRVVNLFSVHLRSLGLTPEDKDAYRDIVKLDSISRKDFREARGMAAKISAAGLEREQQVEYLQRYLAKYGGKNAIVCGDFNDPVGCYALHMLMNGSHMRQAYADAAFGPDITYNANGFYFRIDHILYRGAMRPYNCWVRHIKASDHYPVIAAFVME